WEITGIDNLSTGRKENIQHRLSHERFTFIACECADVDSLRGFQAIFHLAALPRIQPSFELVNQHIQANLNQAVWFMELMIKEQNYPRFVYSGSSAIYGTPENIPTNEEERIDCL